MNAAERMPDPGELFRRLEQLNAIGVALSRETDIDRLLEAILVAAKSITNADGGTLYRVTDERTLKFEIMRNDTLGIAMGGKTGVAVPFPPIALYDADGRPVTSMVAAYAVHRDTVGQHRGRLWRGGLRFLRDQELRPERRDTARGRS